jgi:hypothetical protein
VRRDASQAAMISQWQALQRGWMLGWTIYGPTTTDFPGWYVARAWVVARKGASLPWPWMPARFGQPAHAFVGCLAPTLDEARRHIGGEFTRVGRNVGDDPVILEVWL